MRNSLKLLSFEVDDDSAYRSLHHAAEQGHLGVVRELVDRGADVRKIVIEIPRCTTQQEQAVYP